MSGILGVLQRDGTAVDRRLLQSMTEFLAFRGPDAQRVWIDGPVGLGHALLRTTFEQAQETQPCTVDGNAWIIADARIDDRARLKAELEDRGQPVSAGATDADLILHGYSAWGDACVEHLLGDFAFAIWNRRKRELFCARDHFGVKLFFYAQNGPELLVSNTLSCLRRHPAVSTHLNQLAVADFLLFGSNTEPETTTFAVIRRLPPAHTMTWQAGRVLVRRYWSLPFGEPIRFRRTAEYVERFQDLFRQAVDDRLRTDRVGVFMSGGMDSTSVAAVAKSLLVGHARGFDLRAYTVAYDELIPDMERFWARLTARHLAIDLDFVVADELDLYEGWETPDFTRPEPLDAPLLVVDVSRFRQIGGTRRVVLGGEGGDPLLYPSRSYLMNLIYTGQVRRLLLALPMFVTANRRLPRFWPTLRSTLGLEHSGSVVPSWLSQSLKERLRSGGRNESWRSPQPPVDCLHSEAHAYLTKPQWSDWFGYYDSGVTSFPVEVRQPFFDLRLVSYVLSIPPFPWCENKKILRAAMSGMLPSRVRLRPKAALAADPIQARLALQWGKWLNVFRESNRISEFVDKSKYLSDLAAAAKAPNGYPYSTTPISLACWLESL